MKKFVVIKDGKDRTYLSILGWSENKNSATLFELDDAKNLIFDKKIEFESPESSLESNQLKK